MKKKKINRKKKLKIDENKINNFNYILLKLKN